MRPEAKEIYATPVSTEVNSEDKACFANLALDALSGSRFAALAY
ncbi:MAG TPA: hypothetical protein VMX18_03975 [Candidatus Bipolaricaulota bacterium]|nr:hypothetical protein [Candidatus Bipolaricaulota bacterium]